MEVKQDGKGDGQRSKTPSTPVYRTCNTAALVASFFLILVFGMFVGVSMGECRGVQGGLTAGPMVPPMIPPLPSAYLVQEQHDFMETVQLKGLKYDSALQNIDSGYYIVLSSVLKTKVDPGLLSLLFLRFSLNHILYGFVLFSTQIWL